MVQNGVKQICSSVGPGTDANVQDAVTTALQGTDQAGVKQLTLKPGIPAAA